MKRICQLCLLALLLVACKPNNNVENSVELSATMVVLQVGQDTIVEATVSPRGTTVEWSSEDEQVATVFSGIIVAVGEGMTTITAKAGTASANCVVIVEEGTPAQAITPDDDLSDAVRRLPRSNKRGVSFSNPFFVEDVAILSSGISWVYNWGPAPSSSFDAEFGKYDIDFIPMAWNASYDKSRIRTFVQTHPGCKYLLAFNEPNLKDQARMTPTEAAAKWPELKAFAAEVGLQLVSPAMNYGTLDGYSDPIKWLDEFFACPEVSLNDVSAIALHCYMGAAGAMKSFIDRFDKYGKPIWMTEFCGWEAPVTSEQTQLEYMSETVLMLEADPRVQRYAWFIARGSGSITNKPWNQLLTKTEPYTLSLQGLIYTSLTSFDKTTWLNPAKHILMNTCSSVCTLADANALASPRFLPANDAYGTLYMSNVTSGKWVEFQVDAEKNLSTLNLCYLAYSKSNLQISVDGAVVATVELPRSADDAWHILSEKIALTQGKHTIRLQNLSGNMNIHWMIFN